VRVYIYIYRNQNRNLGTQKRDQTEPFIYEKLM